MLESLHVEVVEDDEKVLDGKNVFQAEEHKLDPELEGFEHKEGGRRRNSSRLAG